VQFRVGAPDPSLTGSAGLLAVAELTGRVGLIGAVDAAVPGFKQRRRGVSAGEFLAALACAQLSGSDHLVGLDHRREDRVSEAFFAHATPASSTVTGLARRLREADWSAVTAATAEVTKRVLQLAAAPARARLLAGPPTIDLDATDIEVYGRKKAGVTYNYLGQRSGRVHAASWAEAGVLAAARLTDSRTTAHTHAVDLVEQALSWLDHAGIVWDPQQRPRVRADIGYCSKDTAQNIVAAGCDFAIGIQRQPKIWRLLSLIQPSSWQPAIGMTNAEVAVIDYPYRDHDRGWPRSTRLIIRRVRHDVRGIGADERARRHRTLAPGQLALALGNDWEHIYGYSFILTNLDTSTPEHAAAVEAWHRHRTDIEELFKQAKHGAALRHLPSGDPCVNTAWVHAAFLAVAITAWLNLVLETGGHRIGVIRWRRELINTPARLVHHARRFTLRCTANSPLPEVLAKIRQLPPTI
jgi:Transposase DDE domain group 1